MTIVKQSSSRTCLSCTIWYRDAGSIKKESGVRKVEEIRSGRSGS